MAATSAWSKRFRKYLFDKTSMMDRKFVNKNVNEYINEKIDSIINIRLYWNCEEMDGNYWFAEILSITINIFCCVKITTSIYLVDQIRIWLENNVLFISFLRKIGNFFDLALSALKQSNLTAFRADLTFCTIQNIKV